MKSTLNFYSEREIVSEPQGTVIQVTLFISVGIELSEISVARIRQTVDNHVKNLMYGISTFVSANSLF